MRDASSRPGELAKAAPARPPRRLSRAARREQLVEAAKPVVAAQGFSDFSLDDIAAIADVSRNLLYHYFPRGRPDVVLAVCDAAGHELTDEWIVDEGMEREERLAANNRRMIEHAMKPTDAWTIYQRARSSNEPEVRATIERFTDTVIAAMSQNHLGTPEPPPRVRLALKGYLAFFGAVLDEARATATPADEVLGVLGETLIAALAAAERPSGRPLSASSGP
jgi:AcrR family transcriptional regulator